METSASNREMAMAARFGWNCLPLRRFEEKAAFMNDSKYTILLVEDEENDATLLKMAFKRNNIPNPVQWVQDGLEAIAYLNGEGAYVDRARYPFPEVLILDLKMPRMSGLELLTWIREHP